MDIEKEKQKKPTESKGQYEYTKIHEGIEIHKTKKKPAKCV